MTALGAERPVPAPAGVAAVHHHTWVLHEDVHPDLGRSERWFRCESCGTPHS